MTSDNLKALEQAAQDFWRSEQSFVMDLASPKPRFYCLAMFPYPSGKLHMGHVRNYILCDVVNRYKIMSGYNVLTPMGWDAFGLPAENAAKQHQISPQAWTYSNIANMKQEMQAMGLGFDWSREIFTCEPAYYRHQQWFFLQLYRQGLAYRKKSFVYWDPVDQTVLAHEQVIDGKGWRSHALVELREQEQWYIHTQPYAEELDANLSKMLHWPAPLLKIQQNWIGKSVGWQITYRLHPHYGDIQAVEVFTTRLATIFGVVCLMLATQHPLARQLAQEYPALAQFIKAHTVLHEKDQVVQGIKTPLHAIHPLSGHQLDIWIVNFVNAEYATGVVGCVPAHSKIDHEFAQTYALPAIVVIDAEEHLINSPGFNGLALAAAQHAIALQYLEQITPKTYFRLKDWCVSRQRTWGCPIPMLYCPRCGIVPEQAEKLPITLEQQHELSQCTQCAGPARREQDTLDTFFESSWYFVRYLDPLYPAMVNPATTKWLPVDLYIGGIEHANLHFLYARLFFKMMRDLGLVQADEPFHQVLTQGMVLHQGEKMSKSKGNTVVPQDMINKYGIDSLRLFMAILAPPQQDFEWSEQGIVGMQRFLSRLMTFCMQVQALPGAPTTAAGSATAQVLHAQITTVINQAVRDMAAYKFNTALSFCLKIFNLLKRYPLTADASLVRTDLQALLKLLHPFAPHQTHYLWRELAFGSNILQAPFPLEQKLPPLTTSVMMQINSKNICVGEIAATADEAQLRVALLQIAKFKQALGTRQIKKIFYIQGRIMNVVTQ